MSKMALLQYGLSKRIVKVNQYVTVSLVPQFIAHFYYQAFTALQLYLWPHCGAPPSVGVQRKFFLNIPLRLQGMALPSLSGLLSFN